MSVIIVFRCTFQEINLKITLFTIVIMVLLSMIINAY